MKIKIYSFDIFDTVLTRIVGNPTVLFLFLGKKLKDLSFIKCLPEEFLNYRINAEKEMRAIYGEVTLSDIYKRLGALLKWNEIECKKAMEIECKLEESFIRPIPVVKERLENLRKKAKRIIFLSDMYLSSNFIKEQLEKYRLLTQKDKCYISCEEKKSKIDGGLFRYIVSSEGVFSKYISHCGNDPHSDIEVPKKIGFNIEPFLEGNLNRYEKILDSYALETEGLSSIMAGASRLTRLSIPVSTPEEKALRDVAAGVMAPVLTGFLLWILNRVQELSLKRLYFISRDGYILLRIARKLVNKLNIECELRYLFGSRQAWHLPAVRKIEEFELNWILNPDEFLSISSVLFRVGISPKEIEDVLIKIGFKKKDWCKNLNFKERKKLYFLFSESKVQNLIIESANKKREIFVKFLKQEGFFDSVRFGLVNIGWRGWMENSLKNILIEEGIEPPIVFYFGLFKSYSSYNGIYETYLFDHNKNFDLLGKFFGIDILMETFCSAKHGLVVDYREDKERKRIYPLLKENNKLLFNWNFGLIHKTVSIFVENLFLDKDLVNPYKDLRPVIRDLLRTFWFNPSYIEAKAWGKFPYESDQGGDWWNFFAERYGLRDIFKTLYKGKIEPHHLVNWSVASWILTPKLLRIILKISVFLGYIIRRFIIKIINRIYKIF